jgi:hypothetical protein
VFALSEILDATWARAAVSEQFIVWRGEETEWKLYLPAEWPTKGWKAAPSDLVIEGTETIRSLIGGEEWRVFALATEPLIEIISHFPKVGHWDEDEEIETFAPFLQAGMDLLGLDAQSFTVHSDGSIEFLPAGLPSIDNFQVETLLEKKPKHWKMRPPKGTGWTAEWQMLWLWIEGAKPFWASHFINPVHTLSKTYGDLSVSAKPKIAAVPPNKPFGLESLFNQCSSHGLIPSVQILPFKGQWIAQAHVHTKGTQSPVNLPQVQALAESCGFKGSWTTSWQLMRQVDGSEHWCHLAISPPVDLALALKWVSGLA